MISKYSIIQYTPNSISGECINIGVVAFDQKRTEVRFISSWKRVKGFAGQDISFLRDFANDFSSMADENLFLPGMEIGPHVNEELISKMSQNWENSIQFSELRTSIKPLKELVDSISKQFLAQPAQRGEREYRDRSTAVMLVKKYVRNALVERGGKEYADHLLHIQQEVNGKYGPHTFDAVVANGRPYMAFQAVSFELPRASDLDQTVDALAFKIFDIRQVDKKLPIGVLALPPKTKSNNATKIYDRALRTYEGLEAEVIEERRVENWLKERVKTIPVENVK